MQPRKQDVDGSVEQLCGAASTHHFAEAPVDFETVAFHYVTCGINEPRKAPIVFLHGLPESWFQWNEHMAALPQDGHYCVAPDLKGYGQSSKEPGDFRHEGVTEQLAAILVIGVETF